MLPRLNRKSTMESTLNSSPISCSRIKIMQMYPQIYLNNICMFVRLQKWAKNLITDPTSAITSPQIEINRNIFICMQGQNGVYMYVHKTLMFLSFCITLWVYLCKSSCACRCHSCFAYSFPWTST